MLAAQPAVNWLLWVSRQLNIWHMLHSRMIGNNLPEGACCLSILVDELAGGIIAQSHCFAVQEIQQHSTGNPLYGPKHQIATPMAVCMEDTP